MRECDGESERGRESYRERIDKETDKRDTRRGHLNESESDEKIKQRREYMERKRRQGERQREITAKSNTRR